MSEDSLIVTSTTLQRDCDKGISLLYYLRDIGPDVERIITVIQKHQKLFNAQLGRSTIAVAATFLENYAEKMEGQE